MKTMTTAITIHIMTAIMAPIMTHTDGVDSISFF